MTTGERWVAFGELTFSEIGCFKQAHKKGQSVRLDGHKWSILGLRVIDKSGCSGRWFVLAPLPSSDDGNGST